MTISVYVDVDVYCFYSTIYKMCNSYKKESLDIFCMVGWVVGIV